MKSRKLAMAIVALTMCAATTATVSLAACNNGSSGEKTHDYEYTVSATDSSKHVVHCKNDNHEGENDTLEAHDFGTGDKCTKCDAPKSSESGAHTHSYGEWQVTAPEYEKEGKAVKVCANDAAHEHDIEVTLPKLSIRSKYRVTNGDGEATYVYKTENGDVTFKVARGNSLQETITIAEGQKFDDEDALLYFKEVSFTPTKTDRYTLSVDTECTTFEVYESKEVYDDIENFPQPILAYGYNPITGIEVNSANLELEEGKEYKFFIVMTDEGGYSFSVAPTKHYAVYDAALGANTITVAEADGSNKVVYEVNGLKEGDKYVVKFAEEPAGKATLYSVSSLNSWDVTTGASTDYEDNYLVVEVNSAGTLRFCLKAEAGTVKIDISDFETIYSTAIEVKDETGADVTEYTLKVNVEDTTLLGYVNFLPAHVTDTDFYVEVENTEIASFTSMKYDGKQKKFLMASGAFLKGLKAGDTKLILTAVDSVSKETKVTKEIILHVEETYETISVGDTIFDIESTEAGHLENLPTQITGYKLTGATPETKYVVTFEKKWGYSWTIYEGSADSDNYLDMYDAVQYLEFTTDENGEAKLFIVGSGAGTLTITLASEFDYPTTGGDEGDYVLDSSGFYELEGGAKTFANVPLFTDLGHNFSTYAVIYDLAPNTVYAVELSNEVVFLNTCSSSKVEDAESGRDTKKITVTSNADGEAYILIRCNSSDLTSVNITVSEYDDTVDEFGNVKLKEGMNTGISIEYNSNYFSARGYFVFNGKSNTVYTVEISQIPKFFGQCVASGKGNGADYVSSTKISNVDPETFDLIGTVKTCTITTDTNGVAYIRFDMNGWAKIENLVIAITEGGATTPDPTPDPDEPSDTAPVISAPAVAVSNGSATVTIGEDDPYDNEEEYVFYRAVTFTPDETATYTVSMTGEEDMLYVSSVFMKEDFDKYYDYSLSMEEVEGHESFLNPSVTSYEMSFTAGTEYTFVIVTSGFSSITLNVEKAAE